tara:strand:+ start:572 stop:1315 length:744 start_codon:yes stop_codon:yes gene_type:complete
MKSKNSKLIFGTMRMEDHPYGLNEWCNFFSRLYERGISQLHTSYEYKSYDLVCTILDKWHKDNKNKRFKISVKLPNPHFDEEYFIREKFQEKIDNYLEDLNIKIIENVQWMWRSNTNYSRERNKKYLESKNEILDSVSENKKIGKLSSFLCFPYTNNFGELTLKDFDGIAVYFNSLEQESLNLMKKAALMNKKILTIRPFAGGKLFQDKVKISTLLNFQLRHEFIDGIIYTCTKEDNLEELNKFLNS